MTEQNATETGDYFLTVDKVVEVLSKDASALVHIHTRQQLYEKYEPIPHLPMWIRGSFNPFQWVADPHRRIDVFDPHATVPPAMPENNLVIKGIPGSAGRIKGFVRHISCPEEENQLQPGEILVTNTTNVGWTHCSRVLQQ